MVSHCRHFGACGGCAVAAPEAIDKAGLLHAALRKAGFDVARPPLVSIPAGTRRRVDLATRRVAGRVEGNITLGLHRARSSDVIDMQECVLLAPPLVALLPPLRVLLRSLEGFRREASVVINLLDRGPDILLRLDGALTGPDRNRLIAFARSHGVLRMSAAEPKAEAELVVMLSPPVITLTGVAVTVPPGGFLQASAPGEAAIIQAVLAGLPKLGSKARIVELYAGAGTLTFALARHARVEAYEGEVLAVAALDAAVRGHGLAGRVSASLRDLTRRPLQATELAGRAAVVLDPPYAGAGAQMRNIAASKVARVIYVSCNPEALAHDAVVLQRAGYAVMSAVAIDQFAYSANVESVVVFGLQ